MGERRDSPEQRWNVIDVTDWYWWIVIVLFASGIYAMADAVIREGG